jgi:hypothetical protein
VRLRWTAAARWTGRTKWTLVAGADVVVVVVVVVVGVVAVVVELVVVVVVFAPAPPLFLFVGDVFGVLPPLREGPPARACLSWLVPPPNAPLPLFGTDPTVTRICVDPPESSDPP